MMMMMIMMMMMMMWQITSKTLLSAVAEYCFSGFTSVEIYCAHRAT